MSKPKCSIMDCTTEAFTKGICQKHYDAARRFNPNRTRCSNGDPLKFLENIQDTEECILWPYQRDPDGYGKITHEGGYTAHSVSLQLRVTKPFPEANALHASHEVCGNRHCVNPKHLRWGTHISNMRDKSIDGKSGHKLDAEKVRKIMELRSTGMYQYRIAELFGITQSVVQFICCGKIWSHVTGITREEKQ